jgi:sodium/potassium-transporting ATPase subunit alpha
VKGWKNWKEVKERDPSI